MRVNVFVWSTNRRQIQKERSHWPAKGCAYHQVGPVLRYHTHMYIGMYMYAICNVLPSYLR